MHETRDSMAFSGCNGHATGIIMKELVRRAIVAIRNERFTFEAQAKRGKTGAMDDIVTSADRAAQAVYVRSLRECFPGFGIVAEEDDLRVPCTLDGVTAMFSVDPLDGTKAFNRRQSHGIGTMLALTVDGIIVAAFIGDVNTQEIYGYRPGSPKVHRISEYDIAETLTVHADRPLTDQFCLLRKRIEEHPPWLQHLLEPDAAHGGACRDIEVTGGSTGIALARLWKGEVGCCVLLPIRETPWDNWPVIGISEALGFVFVRREGTTFTAARARIELEPFDQPEPTIIVHRSRLTELRQHFERRSLPLLT